MQKQYDEAATPIQRLIQIGAMDPKAQQRWLQMERQLNPLALHRRLETVLAVGPPAAAGEVTAAPQVAISQAREALLV